MEGLTNWPDIISDSGDIITLIILNFYMSAIPQKQNNLPARYNLFSTQPPLPLRPMRSPKHPKTEIKIIFQHPNLLYLSDKKVKTKQEISEQIQHKLRALIKHSVKNKSSTKIKPRPATSNFSYTQYPSPFGSNNQPLRCKTSAGSAQRANRRKKIQFERTVDFYPIDQDLEKSHVYATNKTYLQNRQQDKSPTRSFLRKTQGHSQSKLNVYLEMQRRIFNYNNRTIKSNIKKTRPTTQKQI